MLPDYLAPNLTAVFVGTSVATTSASKKHYYSGRGNKFWEYLYKADLTGASLLSPEDDSKVIGFGLGLTDLVKGRAASSDLLLRSCDYDISGFIDRVRQDQPFVIAFNGKRAAKQVMRCLGYRIRPQLGLADWAIGQSKVYVLPSSSAANANPKHFTPKSSALSWWEEFGEWLRAVRPSHFA
ncbi:MAG: mismatch-specific DNA-glycosylase [Phycisphaeraceae bacterium]